LLAYRRPAHFRGHKTFPDRGVITKYDQIEPTFLPQSVVTYIYLHPISFHSSFSLQRGILRVWEVSVVAWQRQENWHNEIFHIHSTLTLKRAKVAYVQFSSDCGDAESSMEIRYGQ
jgi:hypothetical protein